MIDTIFILNVNNIDSYIACKYINYYIGDKLNAIVLDGKIDNTHKYLLDELVMLFQKQRIIGRNNVQILSELPNVCIDTVICCSALTKVANAIINGVCIRLLIAYGGYGGRKVFKMRNSRKADKGESPILTNALQYSKRVLRSSCTEIDTICLIEEDIIQDKLNTESGKLWIKDEVAQKLFKQYNRSAIQVKSNIDYLILSRFALSGYTTYTIIDPILCLVSAHPGYIINEFNKILWYTILDTTDLRSCLVAYDFILE